MKLTVAQLKVLSGLLDEALPLDVAARSAWLEALPPEHHELVPSLRIALLMEPPAARTVESLDVLPRIDVADGPAAATSSTLQSGARVGPYELVRRLGVGGMAEVWLARRADGAFKREVALKLPMRSGVRGDLEGRFARERDILASLEHPLIARFYDAGVDPGGLPYLCMEYVQGQPVTDWCNAGRLPIDARVALFLQVLEAVQYAHHKQVVHRDLKPSNILVTGSGQVRLLDFGVAKLLETAEADQTPLTRLYGRALTPDYAAPELLRGESIDARSDVYSLGVLLYELLTGARPYRLQSAASMGLLDVAIATIEVPKPSAALTDGAAAARSSSSQRLARQLRGPMDAIVLKALARTPAGRYASASEFAAALRRHLTRRPIAAPFRLPDRMRTTGARRGFTAATAGTLVIALAIFFHGHWRRAGDADVTTLPAAAVAAAGARHAAVDAVAPVLTSLVVLPFVNESERQAEAYYPDALTYRLTLLLARVRKLQVTFSTAAQRYRGSGLPVTAIAQQLDVQWVLVGQVHKEGSQIRVAVQLVHAADGQSQWSRTYYREIREAFQLEEEIASGVIEALDAGVLGAALPRRAVPTVPAAYDLLLRALGTWLGPEPVKPELPVEYLRRAVALDPDYADAWAALGWAYLARRIPPDGPNIANARRAAAQALRLDPRNETANLLMQDLHLSFDWDWSAAEKDLGRILESDPAAELLPEAGFLELANGRTARALPLLRQALLRDPLNRIHYNNLGILYYGAGRHEEAEALFRKSLLVDSTQAWAHHHLGLVLLAQGKHDAALAEIARETSPIMRLRGLAVVRSARGEMAESDAALAELIHEYQRNENEESAFVGPYAIASVYAYRGEADAAFEWLERARRLKARGMLYLDVRHDPLLARLQGDARFRMLLRELGLAEADAGS
jgi:serine/threonine protein kinase/TolB-like protein/Flp pilus assembly protein TadD